MSGIEGIVIYFIGMVAGVLFARFCLGWKR